MFQLIYLCFILLLTTQVNANAYIDPGTGGIILQAIIGFIAAGIGIVSLYWQKFKEKIKKIFKLKKKID